MKHDGLDRSAENMPVTGSSVPETSKQTIGMLIAMNAAIFDPVNKFAPIASLIGEVNSALYTIRDKDRDDDLLNILDELIVETLRLYIDEEKDTEKKRIQKVFSKFIEYTDEHPRAKYDLKLLRDFAILERARRNWKRANDDYFSSKDAWGSSHDRLSDINTDLIRIVDNWNIRIIPKDNVFTIANIPAIQQQTSSHPLE